MKNKTRILLLLSVILCGVYFLFLKWQNPSYQFLLFPKNIEFELVDINTNEPVANKMLYIYTQGKWTHSSEFIDSISTDKKGCFILSESIFNKKGWISIRLYQPNQLYRVGRMVGSIRYLGDRKIRKVKFIDGYNRVYGNDLYDLKTGNVTHTIYDGETTVSQFKKIKLLRYSPPMIDKTKNILKELKKEKLKQKELLKKLYDYSNKEMEIVQTKMEYKKLDGFHLGMWSGIIHMVLHEEDIELSNLFEMIDETDDVEKKYNLLYALCSVFNYQHRRKIGFLEKESQKIIEYVDTFYLKYSEIIEKKEKQYQESELVNTHCHLLQKVRGEMRLLMRNETDLGFTKCCEAGL